MAKPPAPPGSAADASGQLRKLYDDYSLSIYRLAYRLTGSKADAEDVLQDVFVAIPEALRGYHDRGRFDSWIHTVAARVALMKLRRRERRAEVALADDTPAATRDAQDVVERVALERALGLLPESLRTVLVLKEVEGYTHAEIGQLLGIRSGTSRVRLHRAHAMLRNLLRSDG